MKGYLAEDRGLVVKAMLLKTTERLGIVKFKGDATRGSCQTDLFKFLTRMTKVESIRAGQPVWRLIGSLAIHLMQSIGSLDFVRAQLGAAAIRYCIVWDLKIVKTVIEQSYLRSSFDATTR